MPRVVFFCRVKNPRLLTSVEFYREDLRALRDLGHEVVVCTRWRELPRSYDAMFVWWWTYASYPLLLSRLRGKPSCVTGTFNFQLPRDIDATDYRRRPRWQRALLRFAVEQASLNLFVSQLELKACTNHFNLSTGRYFPHSVSEKYLQGKSSQTELAIANLAWSSLPNLRRKGVFELLEAVSLLKSTNPGIKLYLAGHSGGDEDHLKRRVEELQIQEQVELLGELSLDEKIALLRRCEIYAQPSHFEGFGVAIAEAMGCGSCVLTCDAGAVREVVGDAGLYVERGSPAAIAKGLQELLANEALRVELQERAQERIKRLFSYEAKVDRLRDCLTELGIASPR